MMYLKVITSAILIVTNVFLAHTQLKVDLYRHYIAYKSTQTMIIDGQDKELAWQQAPWTDFFTDIEGDKTPKYQTQVKMLWDDTHFYILAKMAEPHIWGDITTHDAVIFHNNDFEVFIDPTGDTHNYYELEINALNTVWDLFLTKPYREQNVVLNDWNFTGLKSAVHINGTLNNPNDTDQNWTLEIAIPFKDLRISYGQDNVPKDQFWRVNFSRVNWQHSILNGQYSRQKDKKGQYLPEHNWVWSPMGVINMHEPEKWGYVYFSSQKNNDHQTFAIPKDDKIKWRLYALYRTQKKYRANHKKWATDLTQLSAKPFVVEGEIIQPILESHNFGFVIMAKSPFSKQLLAVKEDGQFISK